MNTYSSALQIDPSLKLEFNGKVYRPKFIVQAIKAKFESWLKAKVQDEILSLPPAERELKLELLREHADNVASGKYGFHTDLAKKAMESPAGGIALLSLVFDCSEEEVMELMLAKGDEAKALLEQVKAQSFPKS